MYLSIYCMITNGDNISVKNMLFFIYIPKSVQIGKSIDIEVFYYA